MWSEDARPPRPVFIDPRESRGSPDRCLEPAKLPLDGFPEVLQQVEAIGDPLRLWRALSRTIGVEPRTVPADNLNLLVPPQPVRAGCCRSICQEVDHPMAFEVNDDRSVAHSFLPRPIINPDDSNEAVVRVSPATPLDHPEDRGAVDRHAKAPH